MKQNGFQWEIYIPKMAYLLTKAKQNRFEIEKKMLKESPIATAKIFVFLKQISENQIKVRTTHYIHFGRGKKRREPATD